MADNNDFTHEFQIYSTDLNAGTMGTGKFLLFDNNINAIKVEDVSNIKIGGGTNGRVLATDGEGNLRWISAAAVTGGISSYNELDNLPTLFSGDYNDLTNKPSIPDLTGYATESWVNSQGFGSGGGATNEITNTDGTSTYSVSVGTNGVVTMTTARGGIEFGAMPEVGGPTHLHIMRPAGSEGATDLYFGDDYNYVKMPGLYGAGTQGVEIGSSYNGGAVSTWRFGTDGHLILPAGGDIRDITGTSVLGGGGSANTGNISFSGDEITGTAGVAKMQVLDVIQTASYSFTPGVDYSTAVWENDYIVFNDPTQAIYDAIWALTNVSTIQVQVAGNWTTVTSTGSSTPGMPLAPTLFINQTAVGGPLNIDIVDITINQGTTSYVEIDGTDFRVDVQDDIRMYANDAFRFINRSTTNGIEIQTADGDHIWEFNPDGTLTLPDSGDILRNGSSVLSNDYNNLSNTPSLATVATSGDYNDLSNKPTFRETVSAGSGPGGNNQADSLILAGINPVIDIPSTWGGDLILQGGVGGSNGDLYGEVRIKSGTIGSNYEWHFTSDKKIKLPAGGDIVDSTGASVLGGSGGGITLPADASGYLNNNGSGTLTWVPGNPAGSGILPYSDFVVFSNTVTEDWTAYTLSGTMDSFNDYQSNIATITLSSATALGIQAVPNTKTFWLNDSKVNSNNYMVVEFPASPAVGEVFNVTISSDLTTVNAGSFVIGETYTISSVGTTSWTSIGASYSGVGNSFVATGAGTGTGTATTSAGAKKIIYKPATGQRVRTFANGSAPAVWFGSGGTYDFMYVDTAGNNSGMLLTFVFAGAIGGTPSWYQVYF